MKPGFVLSFLLRHYVEEDDNRCPPCKNPAVGCFEYCKCNGCNSGECECRNIQDTVGAVQTKYKCSTLP